MYASITIAIRSKINGSKGASAPTNPNVTMGQVDDSAGCRSTPRSTHRSVYWDEFIADS
jgi:hypothetical protein